jgi:hypothetical protein
MTLRGLLRKIVNRKTAEVEAVRKATVMAVGKVLLREANLLLEGRCNICKEKYVGLAQDCRCTNYGRPS